ncbi:STAS domain-containing protein [Streptomyces sp. NBC_00704]|uniref:STAS domain-containing protein n=1 Tax=Streptomyces sp. NBC_00704 TaxID=2975809 RepID=UPI002E35E463|nr:STAS domain-containing protein [Streptomyces sp. NBC_00704]
MSLSQPTPRDDANAHAEVVGGDDPSRLREPSETAVPSRLSVRREDGGRLPPRLVLHFAGDLDVDTAFALRENLTVLAAHATGGVLVLNLSGITFCDTAGLYTLLAIRQTLPVAGVDVSLTQASAVLRAAADRAGLTGQLAFRDVS